MIGYLSPRYELNGRLSGGSLNGTLTGSQKLIVRLIPFGHMYGSLSGRSSLNGNLEKFKRLSFYLYEGETHFTPSSGTQIARTEGKYLEENITIDPIPSNYGLITWNGSYLMVS